ncbi:MAG TPA: phage tail tube protein [Ohtaekwangia sp.]|nr:phage tail tube protein [Ohtaekwangia sp.]
MPTTGKVSGNLMLIYKDGVAIACTTDASFTLNNEQLEVTCKDNDGARQYILGGQDWNFTVGGIFQFDNVGIDDLTDMAIDKETATIRFGTDVVGDFFLEGDAIISTINITSPLNAPVTYTATLQGTGPITKGITT